MQLWKRIVTALIGSPVALTALCHDYRSPTHCRDHVRGRDESGLEAAQSHDDPLQTLAPAVRPPSDHGVRTAGAEFPRRRQCAADRRDRVPRRGQRDSDSFLRTDGAARTDSGSGDGAILQRSAGDQRQLPMGRSDDPGLHARSPHSAAIRDSLRRDHRINGDGRQRPQPRAALHIQLHHADRAFAADRVVPCRRPLRSEGRHFSSVQSGGSSVGCARAHHRTI